MKVKVFTYINAGSERMEKEINDFLSTNIELGHIKQTESAHTCHYVTITVWYDELIRSSSEEEK